MIRRQVSTLARSAARSISTQVLGVIMKDSQKGVSSRGWRWEVTLIGLILCLTARLLPRLPDPTPPNALEQDGLRIGNGNIPQPEKLRLRAIPRPVDDERASLHLGAVQKAPISAIRTVIPVIAHDKEFPGRDHFRPPV